MPKTNAYTSAEKGFHVGLFTSVEVGIDVKRRCGGNFENKMIILLCGIFFEQFHVSL